MEAVKNKWLWGIFISLLTFFAMSHNASALNVNFENYSILSTESSPAAVCVDINMTIYTAPCNFNASPNARTVVKIVRTNKSSGYELKAGDVIEFYVSVYSYLNNTIDGGVIGIQDFRPLNYPNIVTLNFEEVQSYTFDYYSVFDNNLPGEDYGFVSNFLVKPKFFRTYKITQYVAANSNYNIGLNADNYLIDWYQIENGQTRMTLHDLTFYRYSESKENKEVEEKTQGAVDNSQSAGGDSSSSAQTGTTGLLNAITGAVSVISSAQPTNCKINGNMGNLDIGQLDLCANPAPAFVQTIGSLILILMCVPLAISLFNRFIAIFRSFQS